MLTENKNRPEAVLSLDELQVITTAAGYFRPRAIISCAIKSATALVGCCSLSAR